MMRYEKQKAQKPVTIIAILLVLSLFFSCATAMGEGEGGTDVTIQQIEEDHQETEQPANQQEEPGKEPAGNTGPSPTLEQATPEPLTEASPAPKEELPQAPVAKRTYTVLFVDWQGVVLTSQALTEGDAITAPGKDPERKGFRFLGWYVPAEESMVPFSFGGAASGDFTEIKIYARYQKLEEASAEPEEGLPQGENEEGVHSEGVETLGEDENPGEMPAQTEAPQAEDENPGETPAQTEAPQAEDEHPGEMPAQTEAPQAEDENPEEMDPEQDGALQAEDPEAMTEEEATGPQEPVATPQPPVQRGVKVRSNLWGREEVSVGTRMILTAEVQGFEEMPFAYQWQCSVDGNEWEDISGANGNTLMVILNGSNGGYHWRVSVTPI